MVSGGTRYRWEETFVIDYVCTVEMATITSMSYLFRSTGGVIGISGTSAIFQGVVKDILIKKIKGDDAEKVPFNTRINHGLLL